MSISMAAYISPNSCLSIPVRNARRSNSNSNSNSHSNFVTLSSNSNSNSNSTLGVTLRNDNNKNSRSWRFPSSIPYTRRSPKPKPKPKPSSSSTLAILAKSLASPLSETESLKSRLQHGDTLYGLFLCSFCPSLAEIAGLAGYDFVVVDMEHGFGGIPEALPCLQALAATQTPAILRLPETTAAWAKKALDLGPQGIMFPMIDSPDEARKAVSFCRYPPRGVRGAAHPIVRASGYGIDAGYLSYCEDDLLIMCQVESVDAVHKVQEIAAVQGVDCIQMGPTDLSATMGHLWDPGNTKVMDMLYTIEKAVLDTKKYASASASEGEGEGAYLAGFAMPHDSPEQLKARGYHMVSGAVDLALFRSAALHDVNNFKLLSLERNNQGEDADDDKYWSE